LIDGGDGRRWHDSGSIAPSLPRPVRVDLGCGRAKIPGFIGVDRFPLPGVDIVADLDLPLPFGDDSVDLVHAGHSLEHVHDLPKLIREIYRICRHGAQICIVAPYSQQCLNIANPYHKQVFNEHTPRFWTASAATPIDPADYEHPHAVPWGLLESDNSSPDIDIRCMKMGFFYFPAYRDLDVDLQRHHRQRGFDVCDQVVYNLLVIKQPTHDFEFMTMTKTMELYESPYVLLRRVREHCDWLEAENRELVQHKDWLEAENLELVQHKNRLEAENRELVQHKDRLEAENWELVQHKNRLEAENQELSRPPRPAAWPPLARAGVKQDAGGLEVA
jgi:SAM-dependent methyltransferase